MLEKLKGINFTLVAFGTFLLKTLIVPITIADSVIILGLSALYGYNLLLQTKSTLNLNQHVLNKIQNMEAKLNMLTMEKGLKREPAIPEKRFF